MAFASSTKASMALLLPLAATCAGCSSDTVTLQLQPVELAQDCTSAHHWADQAWCNSLPSAGLACAGVKANTLKKWTDKTVPPMSGWADNYDNGTQPFACPWWVSTFSRAYVKFDPVHVVLPGTAQSIASAALVWNTKRVEGESLEESASTACIKYLFEANGPWDRGKTPTTLLTNNLDTVAENAGFIGVVGSVQKWFTNPDQNFGLVIEPARNFTAQYSDARCLDSLENLHLSVKYRLK